MDSAEVISNRIEVFDIAKGIAIIAVVAGHAVSGKIHSFIFLFHMLFFFVLAGYFFKEKSYASFKNLKDFIIKKAQRLLFPYLLFNIIFELLHNFFIKIHFYTTDINFISKKAIVSPYTDIITPVKRFFLTIEPLIQPSWFLFALFFALSLYAVINFALKKINFNFELNKIIILAFLMNASFYLSCHGVKLLYIATVCCVLTCFYIGEKLSKIESGLIFNKIYFSLFFILFVVLAFFLKHPVNMAIAKYNNPAMLVLLSIGAFIFIISLAGMIKNNVLKNALSYIGKHTIPILLLHPVSFKIVAYLKILINSEPLSNMSALYIAGPANLYWVLLYITAGVTAPLILQYIYIYIYIYISGKKNKKSK